MATVTDPQRQAETWSASRDRRRSQAALRGAAAGEAVLCDRAGRIFVFLWSILHRQQEQSLGKLSSDGQVQTVWAHSQEVVAGLGLMAADHGAESVVHVAWLLSICTFSLLPMIKVYWYPHFTNKETEPARDP